MDPYFLAPTPWVKSVWQLGRATQLQAGDLFLSCVAYRVSNTWPSAAHRAFKAPCTVLSKHQMIRWLLGFTKSHTGRYAQSFGRYHKPLLGSDKSSLSPHLGMGESIFFVSLQVQLSTFPCVCVFHILMAIHEYFSSDFIIYETRCRAGRHGLTRMAIYISLY